MQMNCLYHSYFSRAIHGAPDTRADEYQPRSGKDEEINANISYITFCSQIRLQTEKEKSDDECAIKPAYIFHPQDLKRMAVVDRDDRYKLMFDFLIDIISIKNYF